VQISTDTSSSSEDESDFHRMALTKQIENLPEYELFNELYNLSDSDQEEMNTKPKYDKTANDEHSRTLINALSKVNLNEKDSYIQEIPTTSKRSSALKAINANDSKNQDESHLYEQLLKAALAFNGNENALKQHVIQRSSEQYLKPNYNQSY